MTEAKHNPSVVIIGAGMTGMLLVIKLREIGITDITLLEKADRIGGTWRENTYPGIACDVPSHAYTYSFEPNPNWSHHFPPGEEILQYFESVYYKYGINHCTQFGSTVTSCIFNETTNQWRVSTDKGEHYQADLLFSATGLLHHPVLPDIPGRDRFAGPAFHSARWDKDVSLEGKRIGVIGTGSSAAQIIPELIDTSGTQVSIFQRTAQWMVKMEDSGFSEHDKQRFAKQPWRMKLIRKLSALVYSQGTAALTNDNWWSRFSHKLMSWNCRRYLTSSVTDPVLLEKLTPDYKMGCKRVVINSSYYDAIQRPNASLVTNPIAQIEPEGIRTTDGKLHELDILVMATGFNAAAFMRPMEFIGENDVNIEQAWEKKMSAYHSLLIPDFPNFFLMLGPNSPIGNQSVIEISEHQAEYALELVQRWMNGELARIQVKPEALQNWAAMIKERMGHTVWTSGCNSWYLDADGDALAWPDSWNNWLKTMKAPSMQDFMRR